MLLRCRTARRGRPNPASFLPGGCLHGLRPSAVRPLDVRRAAAERWTRPFEPMACEAGCPINRLAYSEAHPVPSPGALRFFRKGLDRGACTDLERDLDSRGVDEAQMRLSKECMIAKKSRG